MRNAFLLLCLLAVSITASAQRTFRLINRGKFDKAERLSVQQFEKFKTKKPDAKGHYKIRYLTKVMNSLHGLGKLSQVKGDFTASQKFYEQADSVYKKFKIEINSPKFDGLIDGLIKISIVGEFIAGRQLTNHYHRQIEVANIHRELGELDTAKALLDDVYKKMLMSYGKKASKAKMAYAAYGEYFIQLSAYDSSRYYFEKYITALYSDPNYIDLSIKPLGDAYAGLSKSYLGLNNTDAAIKAAQKSVRFAIHAFAKVTDGKNYFGKITALNLLAESYRHQKQYDKALRWNDEAYITMNANIKLMTPEKLPILATRGQIFWATNDTTRANACFREMMDIFFHHTQNNFSYLSDSERDYFYRTNKHFVDLAKGYYAYLYFTKSYKQNYIAKRLYEIHLNNKGVLLGASTKLLNAIFSKGSPGLIDQFNQIKLLRDKKIRLIGKGETIQAEMLENEITQKEKQLRSTLSLEPEKYITTDEIVHAIPDSTQLIDVMKCKMFKLSLADGSLELNEEEQSQYFHFIFRKNVPVILDKNNLSEEQLEGRNYKAFLNFTKFDIKNDEAYKAYFAGLEKHLTYHKLILSPDGIYNLINPEILFDGKDYLHSRYQFLSLVSAKDLLKLPPAVPTLEDITLIGWPDYSTHLKLYESSPAELPGTQTEINEIKKVLPNSVSRFVYTRKDANENTVKESPSTSVLHFATHGFFETAERKDPMYTSGLVLAISDSSKNKEDGFLTAYEASNLDLKKTFLVVLSACETGQGEFEDGEGVWGLQRAFQVAGVRYIIMSLFKVDDQVTAKLMQSFYANMANGQNVMLAFKNAQQETKGKYKRPIEWGSFVIKGL